MSRRPLVWPPKVGQRICLDTGYPYNSWSGEVRAIVDRDHAVVRRQRRGKQPGWMFYDLVNRLQVETFNRDRPRFFVGGLRRRPETTP